MEEKLLRVSERTLITGTESSTGSVTAGVEILGIYCILWEIKRLVGQHGTWGGSVGSRMC